VFQLLRRDVLTGVHAAGEKLKVDDLQRLYGTSSSPLREALSKLAQEGLVRADERRGFRVPLISIDDLGDITRMRLMLDVPALRDSIEHGDRQWEQEIVASHSKLEYVESQLPTGRCSMTTGPACTEISISR
jgi:DNA-binding GntR family transcriptional regulator